jgi:hypothetical protein
MQQAVNIWQAFGKDDMIDRLLTETGQTTTAQAASTAQTAQTNTESAICPAPPLPGTPPIEPPPPSPPVPSTTSTPIDPSLGGQCPVEYDVTTFTSSSGTSNGSTLGSSTEQVIRGVTGPVVGTEDIKTVTPSNLYDVITVTAQSYLISQGGGTRTGIGGASGGDDATSTSAIISIVRSDGQPDNCGSP